MGLDVPDGSLAAFLSGVVIVCAVLDTVIQVIATRLEDAGRLV